MVFSHFNSRSFIMDSIYIVINGIGGINWESLTSTPREVENALWTMIVTTVYLIIVTLLISTPIGICAAIDLVEYAKPEKIVRFIRFATKSLAGIPSMKIEKLMRELKKNYTVVIVTHNMQQAGRISDYTSFFLNGEVVESGLTEDIFYRPLDKRTEDYITGRFG